MGSARISNCETFRCFWFEYRKLFLLFIIIFIMNVLINHLRNNGFIWCMLREWTGIFWCLYTKWGYVKGNVYEEWTMKWMNSSSVSLLDSITINVYFTINFFLVKRVIIYDHIRLILYALFIKTITKFTHKSSKRMINHYEQIGVKECYQTFAWSVKIDLHLFRQYRVYSKYIQTGCVESRVGLMQQWALAHHILPLFVRNLLRKRYAFVQIGQIIDI